VVHLVCRQHKVSLSRVEEALLARGHRVARVPLLEFLHKLTFTKTPVTPLVGGPQEPLYAAPSDWVVHQWRTVGADVTRRLRQVEDLIDQIQLPKADYVVSSAERFVAQAGGVDPTTVCANVRAQIDYLARLLSSSRPTQPPLPVGGGAVPLAGHPPKRG
jgi:hypothetical protein